MAKSIPYKKGRGLCIFCGTPGSQTKEHLLPGWMLSVGPAMGSHHNVKNTYFSHDGDEPTQNAKVYQGDLRTKKKRFVCRLCNTGWMSRLQERAKPALENLICAKSCMLNRDDQMTISNWVVMTTCVIDSVDNKLVSIDQTTRTRLWKSEGQRDIPDNCYVWIGQSNTSHWNLRHYHHAFSCEAKKYPSESLKGPNAQATTIGVGHVIIECAAGPGLAVLPNHSVMISSFSRSFGVVPICPINQPLLSWPPSVVINDAIADAMANAFNMFSRSA